jgi:hypothetical protein
MSVEGGDVRALSGRPSDHQPNESEPTIRLTVTNVKISVVAFAYAYHMLNSYRGQQSAAKSSAKHLKEWVEESRPLPH